MNLGDSAALRRVEKALKSTTGPMVFTSCSARRIDDVSSEIGIIPEYIPILSARHPDQEERGNITDLHWLSIRQAFQSCS